ncbi:MAG: FtsX-like permease family protein, partial [Bacteroidota bacterium]
QFKPQRDIAERLDLTVLTDIRLFGRFDNDIQPQGDIRYVYLFAAIALLVLLIACINYMNLATARSARRAREVGVRKAVGANRRQLIYQFLGEAVLISLMAVGLGLVLVQASTPLFEQLIGRELGSLYDHVGWLVAVGGLVMAVGLLAGSYPALYLSRFRPSTVLKGRTRTAGWSRVRQALVVVQFAASCALIACTAVIQQQMRYVQSERLGFDKEQLVVIPTFDELGTQASAFRAELLRQAGVERVSLGYGLPGERRMAISFYSAEDIEDYEAPEDEHVAMDAAWVDAYYLETLGLRLVQGRSFEAFAGADSARVAVVNETAVRRLGWSEPLGKEIDGLRVVGVVEDYHVGSFRDAVEPTLIEFDPAASTHAAVRLSGGDIRATLARLEAVWDTFVPGRPFQHSFMADELEALYRADLRLGRLFAAFAGVAILIACLGFVGLAAFTAEQRTKEIGIRKVLGASVAGIVALLAKDYARLVVLSVVIAVPLAYFAMDRWLEAFAYRVSISPGTFVGVSLVVLGAALLSVGYQSIRAALTDPARSLRYE